jgi:hypothetical protein
MWSSDPSWTGYPVSGPKGWQNGYKELVPPTMLGRFDRR